jgi:PPE-repeat protein
VPPGIGYGSGISAGASASARRKAPEPGSAAVAAAEAAREAARTRRRTRAKRRDHGDEYLAMNVDVDPDWGEPSNGEAMASERDAGALGFAGTAHKESVPAAAGLASLPGDEFGGGPEAPMVPSTWDTSSA